MSTSTKDIWTAALNGELERVQFLLNQGGNVNEQNSSVSIFLRFMTTTTTTIRLISNMSTNKYSIDRCVCNQQID